MAKVQEKSRAVPPREVELAEGYYLLNFEKLLDFVEDVYFDILRKEEKAFLRTFRACSVNARRLFVRLVLRRKSFFRLSKLSYGEIDLEKAITELEACGLLDVNPPIEYPDFLEPFTVKELKEMAKELAIKLKGVSKRGDVLEKLSSHQDKIFEEVTEREKLLWPEFQEEVEKFQLLFFGSYDRDMAQFILEDLGIMRFEPVKIDKKTRYFESREHLENHYEWILLHAELWEFCEEKDVKSARGVLKKIEKRDLKSSPLQRRLSRSYNLIGKLFESKKMLSEALEVYSKSTKDPARERSIRILEKRGDDKAAFKKCSDILVDPLNERERLFGQFFIEKLKKKLELPYEKRKKYPTPPEVVLPIIWDRSQKIETQVLEYLKQEGYKGFYSENTYWSALAALLFWEEYWNPGEGLFFHPFEHGPRDFYSGEFFERQQAQLLKKKESWLKMKKPEKVLIELCREKWGTAHHLMSWKAIDEKNLKILIKTVPMQVLLELSLQILKDPRQYRSGFPDLFLYRKKGDYILGEVKSPNDQIQASQKKWFDRFHQLDIPYAIYRVPQ